MDELEYWRTMLSLTDSSLSPGEKQCALAGRQDVEGLQQLQYSGCSAVDYIAIASRKRDQAQSGSINQSFPWSPMEMQARRAYERSKAAKQKKLGKKE